MLIEWSLLEAATQVPSGWNKTSVTLSLWSWKVQIWFLEVTSQILTVLSSEPDAIKRISGLNFAEVTQLLWAFIAKINFLSERLKTFTVLSSEADKINYPSVERVTDFTGALWLFIHWLIDSTLLFHILIVLSAEPETKVLLLGVIASECTGPLWPINLCGSVFGFSATAIIVPSSDALKTYFRFGLKTQKLTAALCTFKDFSNFGSVNVYPL